MIGLFGLSCLAIIMVALFTYLILDDVYNLFHKNQVETTAYFGNKVFINDMDSYKKHIQVHQELLDEQVKTRKARRVSKGTNTASKKRTKKSTSNNKKSGKRNRVQSA